MGSQKTLSRINYTILGPQGAGKGTQAEILAQKTDGTLLIMGNLIRKTAEKSPKIKKKILAGHLLSDQEVLSILKSHFKKNFKTPLIFDGIPRTLGQAKGLDELCQNFGYSKPVAIFLKISPKTAFYRTTRRKICPHCQAVFYWQQSAYKKGICPVCGTKLVRRADDKPKVIKQRLKEFFANIEPVLAYYQQQGRLIVVDGEPPIKEVAKNVEQKIKIFLKK